MPPLLKYSFVPIFCLFNAIAVGQHFYFENFTKLDGLPTNEIYDLFETEDGVIYIATDQGLVKFEGNGFQSIYTQELETPSVTNICADDQNSIYCSSFDGRIFKVVSDTLTTIRNVEGKVIDFPKIAGKSGVIYSIVKDSLEIYNPYDQIWTALELPPNSHSLRTDLFLLENQLFFYYASDSYIYKFDESKLTPYSFSIGENESLDALHFNNTSIIVNSWKLRNDYYVDLETNQPIDQLNQTVGKAQYHSSTQFNKWLLIGTDNGLYVFDDNFQLVAHHLEGFLVSDIAVSKEGMIFAATTNGGLFVSKTPKINWNNSENAVTYALNLRHEKYVGYQDGTIKRLQPKQVPQTITKTSMPIESIQFINEDIYYLSNAKLYSISRGFVSIGIKDFSRFCHSEIFLGTSAGGNQIVSEFPDDFENYFQNPASASGFYHKKISNQRTYLTFYDTVYNRTLTGQLNGLISYNCDQSTDTINYKGNKILPKDIIYVKDELWVASNTGIYRIRGDEVLNLLTVKSGLKTEFIKKLLFVEDYVYAVTDLGVQRYHLAKEKWDQNLDNEIGLPTIEINNIFSWNDSIHLTTDEGLISFSIDDSLRNYTPPKFSLTSLRVDGFLNPVSKIQIPYDYRKMEFEFEVVSPRSFGNFELVYKLNGRDAIWYKQNKGVTSLQLNNLKDGTYELHVYLINEDEIASKELSYIIEVQPPYYRTNWFYILVFTGILLIIALIFIIRLRIIKRRLTLEKQLKSSEVKAIKSQMNPHFIFNALNSIQDLILQKDIRNSNKYLGKFSMLVREVLQLSSKDSISLEKEIEILNLYLELEKLRFETDFEYQIATESIDELEHYSLPPLIIQPYIENAIKHGLLHKKGNKKLAITFNIESHNLRCVIEDNGIGRKRSVEINARRSKHHQSFATSANEKRIELLNELLPKPIQLTIEDLSEGTKVIIQFPIIDGTVYET